MDVIVVIAELWVEMVCETNWFPLVLIEICRETRDELRRRSFAWGVLPGVVDVGSIRSKNVGIGREELPSCFDTAAGALLWNKFVNLLYRVPKPLSMISLLPSDARRVRRNLSNDDWISLSMLCCFLHSLVHQTSSCFLFFSLNLDLPSHLNTSSCARQ